MNYSWPLNSPEERNKIRGYWLDGRCPCCGGELDTWPKPDRSGYFYPEVVAEGVEFCGRCIGNEHHTNPPAFLEDLLRALVEG